MRTAMLTVTILLGAGILAAGCKAEAPAPTCEPSPPPVCAAGSTQSCVCRNGEWGGAQVCDNDGTKWGECVCDPPSPLPDELRVKRLVLVDSLGRASAALEIADGGPRLALGIGGDRAALALTVGRGGPKISLAAGSQFLPGRGPSQSIDLALGRSMSGLTVSNADGTVRTAFFGLEGEGARLALSDMNGTPRFEVVTRPAASPPEPAGDGRLDPMAAWRAGKETGPLETVMALYDWTGRTTWSAP